MLLLKDGIFAVQNGMLVNRSDSVLYNCDCCSLCRGPNPRFVQVSVSGVTACGNDTYGCGVGNCNDSNGTYILAMSYSSSSGFGEHTIATYSEYLNDDKNCLNDTNNHGVSLNISCSRSGDNIYVTYELFVGFAGGAFGYCFLGSSVATEVIGGFLPTVTINNVSNPFFGAGCNPGEWRTQQGEGGSAVVSQYAS